MSYDAPTPEKWNGSRLVSEFGFGEDRELHRQLEPAWLAEQLAEASEVVVDELTSVPEPEPAPSRYKPPVRITTEDELTAHLEHTYGRPANRASRRAASKKVAREIVRLRRQHYYT